ncbi:MAG: hypothetical protein ACI4SH_08200 [Candidatus Scatosoma sp.]
MRKVEFSRESIVQTKGNMHLTRTKRSVEKQETIAEVNTVLVEILSGLSEDANATA